MIALPFIMFSIYNRYPGHSAYYAGSHTGPWKMAMDELDLMLAYIRGYLAYGQQYAGVVLGGNTNYFPTLFFNGRYHLVLPGKKVHIMKIEFLFIVLT